MSEVLEPNPLNYATFNDFFTRALKPNTRPMPNDPKTIISPVDGKIWQIGKINDGQLINVKNRGFTLEQLLGDKKDAAIFHRGSFAVLYLAPSNYHRIHMPISGQLNSMRYIPGNLFSVNPNIIQHLPEVLAKNERVVTTFDTIFGLMAVILVGAMIVGSIETTWAGVITPNVKNDLETINYREKNLTFPRGIEIGKFKLGSTVILLFPEKTAAWDETLRSGTPIKMGQRLGNII